MLPLAPGDPVEHLLQAMNIEEPTPELIDEMRAEFGLDQPLWHRYGIWLGGVVRGDLGLSWQTGEPVSDAIARRLPATLALVFTGLFISIAWSLGLAFVSARWQGRWPDRLVLAYTRILAALPSFILALLALQFIVVGLGFGAVLSSGNLASFLLAAMVIGVDRAAGWTQLLRSALLEEMSKGAADVARSRGASEARILSRYALPGALMPYLAAVGMSLGGMIGGSPVIESLFTWPGLGQYALKALTVRDVPVIQAFVVMAMLTYVSASLLIDLVSALIDPRLRTGGRS